MRVRSYNCQLRGVEKAFREGTGREVEGRGCKRRTTTEKSKAGGGAAKRRKKRKGVGQQEETGGETDEARPRGTQEGTALYALLTKQFARYTQSPREKASRPSEKAHARLDEVL